MNNISLKSRIKRGDSLFGTFVFSSDPAITEIAGHAGFDFVLVDREHTSLSWRDVASHARAAAAAGVEMIVRVDHASAVEVAHALDIGAAGVVLPHFGLEMDATRNAVRGMRYAPAGERGTCTGTRANLYGLDDFARYSARSNEESVLIVQVEDAEVLPRVKELLADIEVDAIMPGVADLSTSMGYSGQFGHPEVVGAVNDLMTTAVESGVAVGAYVASQAHMQTWVGGKATFFVYSIDYKVVSESYRDARAAFRSSLGK